MKDSLEERPPRGVDRLLIELAASARCCSCPLPDPAVREGVPVVECRNCGMVLLALEPVPTAGA